MISNNRIVLSNHVNNHVFAFKKKMKNLCTVTFIIFLFCHLFSNNREFNERCFFFFSPFSILQVWDDWEMVGQWGRMDLEWWKPGGIAQDLKMRCVHTHTHTHSSEHYSLLPLSTCIPHFDLWFVLSPFYFKFPLCEIDCTHRPGNLVSNRAPPS